MSLAVSFLFVEKKKKTNRCSRNPSRKTRSTGTRRHAKKSAGKDPSYDECGKGGDTSIRLHSGCRFLIWWARQYLLETWPSSACWKGLWVHQSRLIVQWNCSSCSRPRKYRQSHNLAWSFLIRTIQSSVFLAEIVLSPPRHFSFCRFSFLFSPGSYRTRSNGEK
jgi:hypothetical protein